MTPLSADDIPWSAPAETAPTDFGAAREYRIFEEIERERARREARKRLDAEARGPLALPKILTLRERLAIQQQPIEYRIAGWQPRDSRVVVAAQFKAGKTTLIGNTCRSLVDGDPFLGRYHTTPITGSVALLDFEMSERQLDAWLRAQRIRNDDQVIPIPFRGQAAAFNILDPEIRVQWAERLRERRTSYVILDCLRPIFDAIGLDENSEAGRFLVAFDGLLNDAGITEALVVHHMGHSGERSRGDSRIRDWPDVEWRLVRQDERASSARYLTAYGRDVDVSECQLAYDAETRRLTIGGGSRHDAKVERALQAILEVLNSKSASPPSGRAIKGALKETEHKRDDIDLALKLGIERDVLDFDPGSKNSKLYRQKPAPSGVSAKCPPDTASECPGAYISPDTRTLADAVVNIDDYRTLKNGIEDGDGYRV